MAGVSGTAGWEAVSRLLRQYRRGQREAGEGYQRSKDELEDGRTVGHAAHSVRHAARLRKIYGCWGDEPVVAELCWGRLFGAGSPVAYRIPPTTRAPRPASTSLAPASGAAPSCAELPDWQCDERRLESPSSKAQGSISATPTLAVARPTAARPVPPAWRSAGLHPAEHATTMTRIPRATRRIRQRSASLMPTENGSSERLQ
jgi:hypothetical protein